MSDHRYTAIFGGALLTAGVATLAVYRMLAAAATPQHEPTRPVVVVTRDVPPGAAVPAEAISLVAWPARVAPPQSFTVADSVAGRVARRALTRGEPVLADGLAPRGAALGLEGTIAPDRRAMAVRVSEPAGLSGLVRPNSHVDVLVTGRDDASGGRPIARLVMSDVRVLGVGAARTAADEGAATGASVPASVASIVTLEVTPAQAEQLAAAESQGAIQVVLRGFRSTGVAALPTAPAAPAAPAAPTALAVDTPAPTRPRPAPAPRREHLEHRDAAPAPARRGVSLVSAVRPDAVPATAPAAARVAVTPPRADSSVLVRVYRGGQLTELRVEASAPPPPAAAPPAGTHAVEVRTASRAP